MNKFLTDMTKLKIFSRLISTAFLLAVLFSAALPLYAQGNVSGTVTDQEKEPLPGASVQVLGTKQVAITDVDGRFSIRAKAGDVLEIRFLGFETRQVKVTGAVKYNISLTPDREVLGESVVTALGLKRSERSIGYAATKVGGDAITAVQSSNWITSLQGKVAGLNFNNSGSSPISSQRVIVRGETSLSGDSSALFVVDGVPITSGFIPNSSSADGDDPNIDYGDGISDINPDDIESVTILKGSAATALYGSRAGNGAIIITTKSGTGEKTGLGITYATQFTAEKAGFWPDFQTTYGTGSDMGYEPYCFWNASINTDGVARNDTRYAYGEAYGDGTKLRFQYEGYDWETGKAFKTPFYYHDDWFTGIFRTGWTLDHRLTFEGSLGKGNSVRLSYKHSTNEWVLPNTGYKKNSLALSVAQKFSSRMTLNAKVNYYGTDSDNMPASTYTNNNVMYQMIWSRTNQSPKDYWDEYAGGRINEFTYRNRSYSVASSNSNFFNPYYTLYEMTNSQDRDRVLGSAGLNVDLWRNKITLEVKTALDLMTEFRTQRKPYYSYNYTYGFYREQNNAIIDFNNDFMLKYVDSYLGGDLTLTAGFGGNNRHVDIRRQKYTITRLDIEGVYTTVNYPSEIIPDQTNVRSEMIVNSLYGLVSLGWKDAVYLDITGRNDWSSTLSPSHWSYFYPSVSSSVMLDKIFNFKLNAPWINFLKFRGSWANVGDATSPYSLKEYWGATSYPGGFRLSGVYPNENIKPHNVSTWEAGLEGKFFANRLRFDVAVYRSDITNQIYDVLYDYSMGAKYFTENIGRTINRGVEFSFGFTPLRRRLLRWDIDINAAHNSGVLAEMYDGWDPATPHQASYGSTVGNRLFVYDYVGKKMGELWGKALVKAPQGATYTDENGNTVDCSGATVLDAATGMPAFAEELMYLGNVNPDWTGGLNSNFTYKGFSLSMAFTAQLGGVKFSQSAAALGYQGKLKNTLKGRYAGLVAEGVNAVTDAEGNVVSYVKNNTIVEDVYSYYASLQCNRYNFEEYTYDCSFIKMKELTVQYDFPKKLLEKTKVVKGLMLGAYATNLFCLTHYPFFDPESGLMSGSNILRGIELGVFPMTRTYGGSLRVKF